MPNALVDLGLAGPRELDHLIVSDLSYRPTPASFNARPPRNLLSQVYFVRQDYNTTTTTNTTTITESNYYWAASSYMLQFTSYLAVFDQYYLHSVVATVANLSSNSGVSSLPQVYTAIDFDNTANLGSLAAIQAYGTCNADILAPGGSVTRIIMPCNQLRLGSSDASGISRSWCDSANTGVAFYGYRLIANNTPAAATIMELTFSMIWAFRNNI